MNFVCEEEGSASAVLIRALEPTHGIAAMRRRRGVDDERALCSGPGKLCEAMAVSDKQNGRALDAPPIAIYARTDEDRTSSAASGSASRKLPTYLGDTD